MKQQKLSVWIVVAVIGVAVPCPGTDFELDLPVPIVAQETPNYCGPASGQMMMMGYPDPNDRRCHPQDKIWWWIDHYRHDEDWFDGMTNPDGLRDAVMELNPPPQPGRYSIFSGKKPEREKVMFDLLYWMAKRRYPTAALVDGGYHWVVIKGFSASASPLEQHDVELRRILIHDPLDPTCNVWDDICTAAVEGPAGGCVKLVSGEGWYNSEEYWAYGVSFGEWVDQYVAIVEPPETKGTAVAEIGPIQGKIISREEALEAALGWVKRMELEQEREFVFLGDAVPLDALPVNEARYGYYLIPLKHESTDAIPGAILLNG